jgi:hypothetical protein
MEAVGCWRAASAATSLAFDAAWRMDHGRVDARLIHFFEQIILGEGRNLSVGRIGRYTTCPDMHLRSAISMTGSFCMWSFSCLMRHDAG